MDTEMMENTSAIPNEDDDAPMLPEGYADGDDLFHPETWTGKTEDPADDAAEADSNDENEFFEQNKDTGATEPADPEPPEESEKTAAESEMVEPAAPAEVEQPAEKESAPAVPAPDPEIARLRAQVQQLQSVVNGYDTMSRNMGFENAQAMLDKTSENFREAEIKRLMEDPESMARELVERRMSAAATAPQPAPAVKQPQRDFMAEMNDLHAVRPELKGTALPQEVVTAAVKQNVPVRIAYMDYEMRQAKAENEQLRQDLEIARQNAASAAKGPVKSATVGGKTDTKANDPFLKGFYSDY